MCNATQAQPRGVVNLQLSTGLHVGAGVVLDSAQALAALLGNQLSCQVLMEPR